MIGAILAGIGALAGGAGSAAIGLGSGILGGIGGLLSGGAGLAAGGASAIGSTLFGGGQAAVPVIEGAEMGSLAAASAAPGGTGLIGGIAGIGGQLADILPTVGGVMSVIRKPEEKVVVTERAGTLPTPRIAIPTLPAMTFAGQQPQQKVFTTTPVAAKPDYLPLIVIAAIVLLMFMRKK